MTNTQIEFPLAKIGTPVNRKTAVKLLKNYRTGIRKSYLLFPGAVEGYKREITRIRNQFKRSTI